MAQVLSLEALSNAALAARASQADKSAYGKFSRDIQNQISKIESGEEPSTDDKSLRQFFGQLDNVLDKKRK